MLQKSMDIKRCRKSVKSAKNQNHAEEHKLLTSEAGAPVPDNESTMTACPHGSVLMLWMCG